MSFVAVVLHFVITWLPQLVVHCAIGTVYTFYHWWSRLRILRDKIIEKAEELKERGKEITKDHKDNLTLEIFNQYNFPPKATKSKLDLTTVAIVWPLHMLWSVSKDTIYYLRAKFAGIYTAMTNKILGEFINK